MFLSAQPFAYDAEYSKFIEVDDPIGSEYLSTYGQCLYRLFVGILNLPDIECNAANCI